MANNELPRELYWYAYDSHGENPSRAPRYAPHMASVMFEPYTKPKTDKAASLGGSNRMYTYKGSDYDLT